MAPPPLSSASSSTKAHVSGHGGGALSPDFGTELAQHVHEAMWAISATGGRITNWTATSNLMPTRTPTARSFTCTRARNYRRSLSADLLPGYPMSLQALRMCTTAFTDSPQMIECQSAIARPFDAMASSTILSFGPRCGPASRWQYSGSSPKIWAIGE